jgi:hypothetical protein
MDKKPETMPRDAKSVGDMFTNVCTVGALAPNLDKVLDVDDIAMVIVIDKKKQKHLRISYPTRTLARHEQHIDLPKLEEESPGVWWLTTCEKYPGGDKPQLRKECVQAPGKPPLDDVVELGPC